MGPASGKPGWLLLAYELPARPSNARVKTWRRLHALGAVAVKDSVYVLPNTPEAREDFEWMREEIRALGGKATLLTAGDIDGDAREELVGEFRRAREQDYAQVRREAAALKRSTVARKGTPWPASRAAQVLRDRLARIAAMDFFGARGCEEALAAVEGFARKPAPEGAVPKSKRGRKEGDMKMRFQRRAWVTRPRPGIDRMSSAWLIRRFIDPKARFRFAEKPAGAAVPFDMYGVEFGHQGDHCTFETLVARFRIADAAVERLGQVVHDLDLKEERYGLPETAAVGRVVEGLRRMYTDDRELLERGMTMMEALYQSFQASPAVRGSRRPPRRTG